MSVFGNLHYWKSGYKDIGVAMYEAGGSKYDTFHQKKGGGSRSGSHDVGFLLEVVCFQGPRVSPRSGAKPSRDNWLAVALLN
jgi:hypothetical protein